MGDRTGKRAKATGTPPKDGKKRLLEGKLPSSTTKRPAKGKRSAGRSIKSVFRSLPKAIQPVYPMGEPNERVVLYDGELELRSGRKSNMLDGKVYLRWLPSPRIEFEAEHKRGPAGMNTHAQGVLKVKGSSWSAKFLQTRCGFEFGESGDGSVRIQGVVTGTLGGWLPRTRTKRVSAVLFHVPNGERIVGRPVADGTTSRSDRIVLEGGGWRVTLDAVADFGDLRKAVKEVGGYVFTYVGRLERADASDFDPSTIERPMSTLYWMLSFMWGRRTGPTLLVGLSKSGRRAWEQWTVSSLMPWTDVEPWAPIDDPSAMSMLFKGLLSKLRSPIWKHTLKLGIHWYLEALRQAGATEGSLIMLQVAFEQLWWTVFYGDGKSGSPPRDLHAVDKLRRLLGQQGVPMAIPADLPALVTEAGVKNWSDGPRAVTVMRNALVHPSRKSKLKPVPTGPPLWEAWRLSVWYLEMVLLSLVGYKGQYHPRIPQGGNWLDLKPVPWASKTKQNPKSSPP